MPALTFRLGSGQDGNFGALAETDQGAATRTDGWTVGKLAAAQSAEFDAATKQATTAFSAQGTTAKPASFLTGATANAFKTPNPLTGVFANAAWTLTFALRASVVSAQAGRVRVRVFRSANASGSGATEVTGATQVGTTSAVLSTSADVTSVVTWSPGATVTLANEYLFFVVAWEITTASGSNTADALFRTGQAAAGSRFVTPTFVATYNGSASVALTNTRVTDGVASSPPVPGVPYFVGASKGKSTFAAGGGTAFSWSHTVPAGTDRILIVSITSTSGTGPNTVTYGGVAMTLVGQTAIGNAMVEHYALANPTVGTATVAVTMFSTSRTLLGFGLSYTGVTSVGGSTGTTGNNAAPDIAVPTVDKQLVVDCVMQWHSTTTPGFTPNSGQTVRGQDGVTDTVAVQVAVVSEKRATTTSTVMDWVSNESDQWAQQGVVLTAVPSVVTYFGSATASLTDALTTAARFTAKTGATAALADTRVTSARVTMKSAAAVALADAVTTAGTRKFLAAASVALTNARTTAGVRKTFAAASVGAVVSRTTNATRGAVSAATAALTNARTTAARVTMKSATTTPLVVGAVTAATRRTFAASTVSLTDARVTAARFTARAATATAEVVGVTTAARRILVGAATVALTDLRTTAARITARSASSTTETATVTTNASSGAGAQTYFGASSVTLTDTRVTNATRRTFSSSTVAVVNVRVTAARVTFRGAATVALTNSRTTVAVRRANASASVQLADVRVTAARLTAKAGALVRSETVSITTSANAIGVKFGAATVALTDARVTNGVRKTFSAATVALSDVRVTGAVRKAFGVVGSRVEAVSVTTNATTSAGAVTYFGSASVQLTDARTTAATRKTFGVVSRPETVTVTSRGARVWYGVVYRPEAAIVTTAAARRANAASSVQLRALVFTSADSVIPLPPGRIDSTATGRIASGRGGRIARTVHG